MNTLFRRAAADCKRALITQLELMVLVARYPMYTLEAINKFFSDDWRQEMEERSRRNVEASWSIYALLTGRVPGQLTLFTPADFDPQLTLFDGEARS